MGCNEKPAQLDIDERPKAVTSFVITEGEEFSTAPKITIHNATPGHTIKIYNNNNCKGEPLVSGVAVNTSLEITLPYLAPGTHELYSTASTEKYESECSVEKITFTQSECPDNFIKIKANPSVGTFHDFCVMKYEAQVTTINSESVAVSQASGYSKNSITAEDAFTSCANIPKQEEDPNIYSLISNSEWMTVAREIESVTDNWSSGTVATGTLNIGWNNASNTAALRPNMTLGCEYNTGVNLCGNTGAHLNKRTHQLANGEVIWDFSGHLWEWVDWEIDTIPPETLTPFPTCTVAHLSMSDTLNGCSNLKALMIFPHTPALAKSWAEGQGTINYAQEGIAARGGTFNYAYPGIYSTLVVASNIYSDAGFRCVYRLLYND